MRAVDQSVQAVQSRVCTMGALKGRPGTSKQPIPTIREEESSRKHNSHDTLGQDLIESPGTAKEDLAFLYKLIGICAS